MPVSPIVLLSPADQRLVKGKQHLVEGKHVVVAVDDEILHDGIEVAAVLAELRRIEAGAGVDSELLDTIQMIAAILGGMKEE